MEISYLSYLSEAAFVILLTYSLVFGMTPMAAFVLVSLVISLGCTKGLALIQNKYKIDLVNQLKQVTQDVEDNKTVLNNQADFFEKLQKQVENLESRSQHIELDRAFKRQQVTNAEEIQRPGAAGRRLF